jgi:hypothetical protein
VNNDIMQKIAQVAPRHYAFLTKTADEIKTSPFRDEIFDEMGELIKEALDWNSLKGGLRAGAGMAGKGALALGGAVGAAAAGGIALALAGDLYESAKRGITKGRDYKSMMQQNPQLQKFPAKDVQKAFSVLHRFNPDFAGDPTVAGAWVGSRVELGQDEQYGNITELKSLIDSRKNLADIRKLSPFKPERKEKGPPGLSKADLGSEFAALHDRFTGLEQNMGPVPTYPMPGGGHRTTP